MANSAFSNPPYIADFQQHYKYIMKKSTSNWQIHIALICGVLCGLSLTVFYKMKRDKRVIS